MGTSLAIRPESLKKGLAFWFSFLAQELKAAAQDGSTIIENC
jgi:hypothetical protein